MFVWHHHSLPITQYFSHYLWAPYLSPGADFLFFLQYPNSLNLVGKKKKPLEHEDRISERRTNPKQTELVKEEEEQKKRKKNQTANPGEERKKKSQKVVKRCGRVLFVGSLCVFNYNIVIEL